MKKEIKEFKDRFDKIEIPENLDCIISESINRGKKDMVKRNKRSKFMMVAASVFIVITAFVVGVNTSPAFAEGVSNVIGSPTLVRIFQFNNQKLEEGQTSVQGGEITDGMDINTIDISQNGDIETITINISDGYTSAIDSADYQIDYYEYPDSIIITMNGVRAFSAIDDFAKISESNLIGDIYRIMTLDDSAHRFAIVFNKPVALEIKEMRDPAQIIIHVKADTTEVKEEPVYSLRTASYEFGEMIGIMEERLAFEFNGTKVRMMKDETERYLVEEGYYATEEEALARRDALINEYDLDFDLHIEKRDPLDIPKAIVEAN